MTTTPEQSAPITWQPRHQLDQPAVALDANGRLNKSILLQALCGAFNFPDYFGDNWDAAYDLLLDHVDQLSEPALWRFSIEDASEVDEADLADWIQLMMDVCTYANAREIQVRVEIYGDALACGVGSLGFTTDSPERQ
ncbi:barstar family protein [Thiopseudomonas acetoxidans]|uniref:Barstar family protein n=1 Tax=Thiopseudomonas acetoxidans TaxID=3041622 RepID=A0ABT7SNY1_9GAMM|nr:barstar family protein [Thiopseudomonas sp. CY1220]MDM7857895.1 barstar family protein [Thiopseudomonas sp. CY1220]